MGRPCIIENCDQVVSDNSRLDACQLCRASINRWKRRTSAQIYDRRQQLTKYSARMEPLVDDNVMELKTKKRREEMAEKKGIVRITSKLVRIKKSASTPSDARRSA